MMNLFENIAFYAAERHHQKKWLNLANKKTKQTKKEKIYFPSCNKYSR